jgi:hypothetical protein
MERRALGAEAPTLSTLAEPTSATPVLFMDTTPRATTLTVPTTGLHDIVALRVQGSHGIADGGAEIGGHFRLSAGEAPRIVVGADVAKALMCGDAGVDGGVHVD